MNKTKSWFFNKINKNNHLPCGKYRENRHIISIRSESGDIPTKSVDTKMIIIKYYEQFHGNNIDNTDEMEKFLECL